MRRHAVLISFLLLAISSFAAADVIRVPEDQQSVQAGIDAAVIGDEVVVAPGVYVEKADLRGKAITLRSEAGPEVTILDGAGDSTVITCTSGEGNDTVIEGFTVQNGWSLDFAGGITCNESRGGGMYLLSKGWATVSECVISRNFSHDRGGGIHASGSGRVSLSSNLIENNRAVSRGGVHHDTLQGSTLNNNVIRGNVAWAFGGGLYNTVGALTLRDNVISDNVAVDGGGVCCIAANLEENTIEANEATSRGGGWPGEGNIDADPRFVNAMGWDFHLRLESPCVDAGTDMIPLPARDFERDPRVVDGNRDFQNVVDIGADELLPEVAVRFGKVNAAEGWLADVLFVNESVGDAKRTLELETGEPMVVDVFAPPSATGPTPFALYAWVAEPDKSSAVLLPRGVGAMVFPVLLTGGVPQPTVIWNNLGAYPRLGVPTRPSSPAPSTVLSLVHGIDTPMTLALQGIILDRASASIVGASATNAVVIEVR